MALLEGIVTAVIAASVPVLIVALLRSAHDRGVLQGRLTVIANLLRADRRKPYRAAVHPPNPAIVEELDKILHDVEKERNREDKT